MRISVIIPARNEAEHIAECIHCIKSQVFDDYETIVVDNGSTDNTSKIAMELEAKVVSEPNTGLPLAREKGRRTAKGEVLVYLDADMIIPPWYLKELYKAFTGDKAVVAASNPYKFYDGGYIVNTLALFFFKIFLPPYNRLMAALGTPLILLGGNFAVKKSALDRIGGFNEDIRFYGEDTDIARRISREGKILFVNNLYTLTSARRYNRQGIAKTVLIYVANYFSVALRGRPL